MQPRSSTISSAPSLPLSKRALDQLIRDAWEAAQKQAQSSTQSQAPSDFERCRVAPAYFIHEYVVIDNAQPGDDTELGTMPFHLWPAQSELLDSIQAERLLLILKARQLGISWLVCAYVLWLCLFRPGRLVLMFSIGQDEADELLRRVSVMYHRLPETMRAALPALSKENTSEMGWASGSRVESLPTTKKAGSGYTASLVVLDEFSKNQWAKELYTAAKPTIDGGGKMIILSSANGTGNLFHEMCERAQKAQGRFAFRFLPWWARPGRDAAWYAATEADAVSASLMRQEYPATAEEAFDATNVERFLPSMTLWDACRVDLPPLDPRQPLVLALDASVTGDTFACVGVSRNPISSADVLVRLVRAWEPHGQPLDYNAIEGELRAFLASYNVVQICYDPYQLHQMAQRLSDTVWCEPFSQAGERLEADRGLLDLIVARGIGQDGDPLLRQHLDNADRKVDTDARKLRIVKRTPSGKIDLAVALSMASYRCLELNVW